MTTAFGNANSAEHVYGETAAALVADARREVAALVDAAPEGGGVSNVDIDGNNTL
jgi:cysteine desulfurase